MGTGWVPSAMYGALKTCSMCEAGLMPMYLGPEVSSRLTRALGALLTFGQALSPAPGCRRVSGAVRTVLFCATVSRWLTSCSSKETFFNGMRWILAFAAPSSVPAARSIADFMIADDGMFR
jgi:hypothetical protein